MTEDNMVAQMELDFSARRSESNPSRPHHRTTILTTTRRTYDRVRNLAVGEELAVEAVNDIISSAKGGNSVDHHMLRRSALIRRQFRGGFYKVKVRSEGGEAISCRLLALPTGYDDDCSFTVRVARESA